MSRRELKYKLILEDKSLDRLYVILFDDFSHAFDYCRVNNIDENIMRVYPVVLESFNNE
jgi:hypothetical protein